MRINRSDVSNKRGGRIATGALATGVLATLAHPGNANTPPIKAARRDMLMAALMPVPAA
jgi:hypothetical protein